jgi:hypothetical protein
MSSHVNVLDLEREAHDVGDICLYRAPNEYGG